MHKFDIICMSETFLNNTYEDNDVNLNGYSLLRADHPSNAKRRGVCIYYKENLPLKLISTPYLNESLLCEVTIGSKKCIIGTVYRSPSQISDECESFLSNFEFLLQDISMITLIYHCYSVIIMQEIQTGGIMIVQQLKEFNLKLPQLFTGSNN